MESNQGFDAILVIILVVAIMIILSHYSCDGGFDFITSDAGTYSQN